MVKNNLLLTGVFFSLILVFQIEAGKRGKRRVRRFKGNPVSLGVFLKELSRDIKTSPQDVRVVDKTLPTGPRRSFFYDPYSNLESEQDKK